MQRMGGINCITLSTNQMHVLSVGQERRMTYWDNSSDKMSHQVSLDGENDEGRGIAM
jgi:hypothetical protein